MTEIEKMAIATSLRNMLKKGWVSICDIDQCLKLAGIQPRGNAHAILQTLHCVSFKDMPDELASKIPSLIGECFNGIDINEMIQACEPAQGKLGAAIKRLLN